MCEICSILTIGLPDCSRIQVSLVNLRTRSCFFYASLLNIAENVTLARKPTTLTSLDHSVVSHLHVALQLSKSLV